MTLITIKYKQNEVETGKKDNRSGWNSYKEKRVALQKTNGFLFQMKGTLIVRDTMI